MQEICKKCRGTGKRYIRADVHNNFSSETAVGCTRCDETGIVDVYEDRGRRDRRG